MTTLAPGTKCRFFVRWSTDERFGTVTRVGFSVIWIGAYCFHHDDITRIREVRP